MTDEEKKLRDREKRLLKNYGISLVQYAAILAAQDCKCGACGRPSSDFTIPLNVDHFHYKVTTTKTPGVKPTVWFAATVINGLTIIRHGKTKTQAVESLHEAAKPQSVRGLLCPGRYTGCNRLMGRIDKPEWLRKVIQYLENPPARKVLTIQP